MASPSLLATKLRIPPQPQWTVARVALLETLEEKVPLHRLTLVTAPAGYGKTTLASEWAQQSVLPVAWLSLGEGENHLERFLRYLFAAWKEVDPGVAESTLGVLLGGQMPEKDSVLAAFTNVGSKRDEHLVFVLDDFHLIDEPSVLAALAFLHHLPCSALCPLRARRAGLTLGALSGAPAAPGDPRRGSALLAVRGTRFPRPLHGTSPGQGRCRRATPTDGRLDSRPATGGALTAPS